MGVLSGGDLLETGVAAIFFDLDGTLCAPTVPFRDVFGDIVAPLLLLRPDLTLDGVLRLWGETLLLPGPSTTTGCLQQVLAACAIAADEGFVSELAASLNARWAASQALVPAARSVLERLTVSWPLGLITNGPDDAQRAVIDALGIAPLFRWLLVSGDAAIGSRKPDPAIFSGAAHRAGGPPRAMLYVGDSPANDVAGAAAAGWQSCWVNSRALVLPSSVPQPDMEIHTLAELPAAIDHPRGALPK
jgi:HAD superfamily hydrolase (TIGR01549 family)